MSKDPKELVKEIVRLVGKPEAERLLVIEHVSTSVAGKLVRGTYTSELGQLMAAAIARARAAAEQQAS